MNVQLPPDGLVLLQRPPSRKRRRLALWWAAAGLAVLLGLVATRYGLAQPAEGFVAVAGPLAVELRGPGTLSAINKVTLGARTSGRLTEINVDRNDRVARGQVLARLDSGELSSQLAAAEATGRATARAVEAAAAERERASATLANASAVHERQVALLERGIASQAALDSATAGFRQAQADLSKAERSIDQATAEAQSAAAKIGVAKAQLDDTVLRAPFEGVVVSRERNPGDIITAGQSVLQLVDPATIVLTARFDESAIAAIHPGQSARLAFVSRRSESLSGRVLRLGRSVDEETREFSVDIALDALPENWALGQRGTVVITVDRREGVVAVPKSYLERRDGEPGLWIESDGRAMWRAVKPGSSDQTRVEVKAGLAPGETVLKPGRVYPFMRVVLREAAP